MGNLIVDAGGHCPLAFYYDTDRRPAEWMAPSEKALISDRLLLKHAGVPSRVPLEARGVTEACP
jgi:hypothetical protein